MLERIVDLIRTGHRFLVTMHRRPDGDALGASLALAEALREMGKEVLHYNPDPPPYNVRWLPGCEALSCTVPTEARFDASFVCDTPSLERLGPAFPRDGRAGCLVNIDHHEVSRPYGDLKLIDTQAAAAGVLVFRLLQALEHPISHAVAHALYASILTDTGSFRYDSTDPEALHVTGELIAAGVRPWEIASRIYESQPAARVRLLAKVLDTLEVAFDGRWGSLTVTNAMLDAAGASRDMLDGFVNHARAVDGVEVAALFVEEAAGERWKVSFRSRGHYDLTALGKRLGGKGSPNAASVVLTGTLPEVKERVSQAVAQLFGVPASAVA
ncbi:MAG: bifunctional oligoribonuclease/PAP phosphatase NrnA [Deltaproteobacteria bacterium]|nr:MAG: bifunctional oligoribonuclease/PAP phosphatase NrnA [Deltaproteobacteria bacterium]